VAEVQSAGRTVLLVEDDEALRNVVTKILQRAGYAVAAAPDGAGATAFLHAHPETAVVLLDMLMPGRDGWDFLARRKRDPALARIPVIITSGLGVATPEWAESLGACACFRKPYPFPELLAEVRRLAT
jgi:CheY-like chemotaxis protein